MNALVVKLVSVATAVLAPAALVAADSFHTGQFTTTNGYTPNLTLLTGPHFLSPAPQAGNQPARPGGTLTVSSGGAITLSGSGNLRLSNPAFHFVPAEEVQPPTDAELHDAQEQLRVAQDRLAKLQAQHYAALAQPTATPHLSLKRSVHTALPADPTRFDTSLPEVPTSLLRKPASAPEGELYFKPGAPGRE